MNIKNNKKAKDSIIKIQNSLCQLLTDVGHKSITIKNVCANAKINRTTFYAHFDNIEDALYKTCEEYVLVAYNIFLNNELEYKNRVKQSLDIIKNKLEFFAYAFSHVHNLDQRVIEMVENYSYNHCNDFKKSELSLAFIIAGFIGICKKYFLNKELYSNINLNEFTNIICNSINLDNPYLPM